MTAHIKESTHKGKTSLNLIQQLTMLAPLQRASQFWFVPSVKEDFKLTDSHTLSVKIDTNCPK